MSIQLQEHKVLLEDKKWLGLSKGFDMFHVLEYDNYDFKGTYNYIVSADARIRVMYNFSKGTPDEQEIAKFIYLAFSRGIKDYNAAYLVFNFEVDMISFQLEVIYKWIQTYHVQIQLDWLKYILEFLERYGMNPVRDAHFEQMKGNYVLSVCVLEILYDYKIMVSDLIHDKEYQNLEMKLYTPDGAAQYFHLFLNMQNESERTLVIWIIFMRLDILLSANLLYHRIINNQRMGVVITLEDEETLKNTNDINERLRVFFKYFQDDQFIEMCKNTIPRTSSSN